MFLQPGDDVCFKWNLRKFCKFLISHEFHQESWENVKMIEIYIFHWICILRQGYGNHWYSIGILVFSGGFLLRGGPENWKSQLFGETTWKLLKNCIISVKQQKITEIVEMSTFPCFCRALVAPWRKHQYSYRIIDGSGSVPGPPNRPRAPEMQIFTKMTCILCFHDISWKFIAN